VSVRCGNAVGCDPSLDRPKLGMVRGVRGERRWVEPTDPENGSAKLISCKDFPKSAQDVTAIGKHGARARCPDLTQTLQPPRPALARNREPAGSLSQE
jgi:hypothetical protein